MPYNEARVGWQKTDTSKAAADDMKPKAKTLRDQAYDVVAQAPTPVSTEYVAYMMDKGYASVQPRLSELQNEGRIIDSGRRGINLSGKSCILWKIKGETDHGH
jgi:biotin operon repressor